MALIDTVLSMITRKNKNDIMTPPAKGSRSEREAKIKDKAGMVINVFALLLAVNTYFSNGYSSLILNNTIKANDTWSFYQAKALKQTLAEYALDSAVKSQDHVRIKELTARIERYDCLLYTS